MTMLRCLKCMAVWCGDTGPVERFVYITNFCPQCIEKFPSLPNRPERVKPVQLELVQ